VTATLNNLLSFLSKTSQPPEDQVRIFFSAWVTLENEAGKEITYRIVGADELDPKKQYISLDSPLARALLKKTFDDEVAIKNELKESRYTVVDINYGKP
jgi:transcription elongation factor GreB